MGKYFIAIALPEPLSSEVQKIRLEVAGLFGCKAALRSPPHITLHLPFEWKRNREKDLFKGFSSGHFEWPLRLQLSGFSYFGLRVFFAVVKPCPALISLQKGVVRQAQTQLHLLNEVQNLRPFHPHVTLAFRDIKKETFGKILKHFEDVDFNRDFTTESFHLLRLEKEGWKCIGSL